LDHLGLLARRNDRVLARLERRLVEQVLERLETLGVVDEVLCPRQLGGREADAQRNEVLREAARRDLAGQVAHTCQR